MIPRTKEGLLLERLFSTMHDYQGYSLRHLLCYTKGSHEDVAYDCACCLTWPDDQLYSQCGCVCHERIETIAAGGDMRALLSTLVFNGELPVFPESHEHLQQLKSDPSETPATKEIQGVRDMLAQIVDQLARLNTNLHPGGNPQ